jgi:alginate O-acetyltransferase complex protein AlgI
MLFNSIQFFIFLIIVFSLYWFFFKNTLRLQNGLIVISSYIFYSWWDWRFLTLILLSTIVDYYVGLRIYNSEQKSVRKRYLWISILFNLSLLGFFKYYNFFVESWVELFQSFGYTIESVWTLNIILPVGISFYTFQTISYSLDIYKKELQPTKDFISFASYVSFFPQLVAGPIERASRLLPQMLKKRYFNISQAVQGLRLILWGLFKKVVIADSLAIYVDQIFDNIGLYNGGELFLGLVYFAIQIYCDFSGYSDIAIGTAKLFGIELMSNFKFPYFSRDIGEFWRRWHISLSSWFRDYLYIPLGGSKKGRLGTIKNIFIIFIVSGFWHGSNWTFICWGLFHAIMYIPLFLIGNNRKHVSEICCYDKKFPSLKEIIQISTTFFLTTIAWVFFRSESIDQSFLYLNSMVTKFSLTSLSFDGMIYVVVLYILDWLWRKNEREPYNFNNRYLRYGFYTLSFYAILLCRNGNQEFIYFQF